MRGRRARVGAHVLGACAREHGMRAVLAALRVAHARASARGTPPSSHPITPLSPQFDLTRCAATREKVNYAVNERVPGCIYIRVYIYIYIYRVAGVLPKRETSLDRYVDRTDRDEVRI